MRCVACCFLVAVIVVAATTLQKKLCCGPYCVVPIKCGSLVQPTVIPVHLKPIVNELTIQKERIDPPRSTKAKRIMYRGEFDSGWVNPTEFVEVELDREISLMGEMKMRVSERLVRTLPAECTRTVVRFRTLSEVWEEGWNPLAKFGSDVNFVSYSEGRFQYWSYLP